MDTPEWLDQERPYLLGISGGREAVCLLHWFFFFKQKTAYEI